MAPQTAGLLVSISPDLERLARRAGVATSYLDQGGHRVDVSAESVRAVLDALGPDEESQAPPAADPAPPLPVGQRAWGWAVQLYAIPSRDSWGVGDLRDLRTLVEWTGARGGGLVLVNPLHAVAPGLPMQPSPYFPSSRRWTNPLYLRVEDTQEFTAAAPATREAVMAHRVEFSGDRIDRDTAWAAKLAALELLCPKDTEVSAEVEDFATWCALAEEHGNDWREWDESLQRPDSRAVAQARERLADRVRFHAWLQQLCDRQLAAVDEAARQVGMPVGVMHDLAVGTDPGGADAWSLQRTLALDAHIGAPPDGFNQQGQDWGMPPWHPRQLATLGYQPLRDLVRGVLRHAGGVRIDHILGMFRAWWVPAGGSARDGTYVTYDAAGMLGAVTSEARAAGAVVVGEDLGTVPPQVRKMLAERGVLGTSVLWFERDQPDDDDADRPPLRPLGEWREAAMASVTTHDLPTALGWLRGEHVRVRAEHGLLNDPAAEQEAWLQEREELLALLTRNNLIPAGAGEAEIVRAMHLAVGKTPSRYVVAALGDAVGDLRQPNLPGTTDEYPNWRLPVADADGRVLLLDDLLADGRVERIAADLAGVLDPGVR